MLTDIILKYKTYENNLIKDYQNIKEHALSWGELTSAEYKLLSSSVYVVRDELCVVYMESDC